MIYLVVMESSWDALIAIAGVVTALGTVAMAIAVVVTAVIAARTLRAARDDSRARSRPTIVAELRRELLAQGTILLVLRNLGSTVASNVRVSFDPGPASDIDALADSDMWKWVFQRYSSAITTWAPGWTLSNVIRTGDDPLPPLSVTVEYDGPDGTHYGDVFLLHPDHILKETSSNPTKGRDAQTTEQQKVAALQALVRTVRSL